jgi:hypothetical protein
MLLTQKYFMNIKHNKEKHWPAIPVMERSGLTLCNYRLLALSVVKRKCYGAGTNYLTVT